MSNSRLKTITRKPSFRFDNDGGSKRKQLESSGGGIHSASTELMADLLQRHFLFSCLRKTDLLLILESMKRIEVQHNSTIIHEGQWDNDSFFFLEQGVAFMSQNNNFVSSLKSPCFFEDLSLVGEYEARYSISVSGIDMTSDSIILWKLSRNDYRNTLASLSSLHLTEARSVVAMIPLFSQLTSHQVNLISQSVEMRLYLPESVVYEPPVNGLEIIAILEGTVMCQSSENDYKSELCSVGTCLGLNLSMNITCIATTLVKCAVVSKDVCDAVLGSLSELNVDNKLRNTMTSCLSMYDGLSDFQLSEIVRSMKENVVVFEKGSLITTTDHVATDFYILRSGKAFSLSDQTIINTGDVFGAESLSLDPKQRIYKSNIVSIGETTDCYVLQVTFLEYLGLVEPVVESLDIVVEEIDSFQENCSIFHQPGNVTLSKTRTRPKYGSQLTLDVSSHNSVKQLNRSESMPVVKTTKIFSKLKLVASSVNDFQILSVLGEGSFGKVKLAKHSASEVVLALKVLSKFDMVQTKQCKNVVRERQIMTDLKHPFIVNLYGAFQDQNFVYMMLEFVQGGELESVIHGRWPPNKDSSPECYSVAGEANEDTQFDFNDNLTVDFEYRHNMLDDSTCQFYAACIVSVLDYIHLRSIAFRDLKPENLLIDRDGYIKVIDWGFAKVCSTDNDTMGQTFTLCGTPEYIAPESVLGIGHSVGVDCWSLGVILYEMATGYNPFLRDEDEEYYDPMKIAQRVVKENISFECLESLSPACKGLISRLCTKDPKSRLGCSSNNGIKDIMSHEFFNGISWTGLYKKWLTAPWTPQPINTTDACYYHCNEDQDEFVPFESDVYCFEGF